MTNGSKAFYLKNPRMNKKAVVVLSLMLLLLTLANPYLLIIFPVYIFFLLRYLKSFKSEVNIMMQRAIDFYDHGDYKNSLDALKKVTEIENNNDKANIIMFLIYCKNGEYQKAYSAVSSVPEKLIKNDIDLQLKLAECYTKLNRADKAKDIYTYLLKIAPNSDFLKEMLLK